MTATPPMTDPARETVNVPLLPCPFCGVEPDCFPSGDGTGTMIECATPDCVRPLVSYYGDGVAEDRWNRRAAPSPSAPWALLTECEDALRRAGNHDLSDRILKALAQPAPQPVAGPGKVERLLEDADLLAGEGEDDPSDAALGRRFIAARHAIRAALRNQPGEAPQGSADA